jgi:hypothetical protein
MQWLIQNKEWIFSGIGLPISVWIINLIIKKKKNPEKLSTSQSLSQSGGNHSTNIQGGKNVNVTMGEKNAKK